MAKKKLEECINTAVALDLYVTQNVTDVKYNTKYEAYAILKESIENIEDGVESLNLMMRDFWSKVKQNGPTDTEEKILSDSASYLIHQSIHLAALIKKLKEE